MTEFADQSILPEDKKNHLTPDVLGDDTEFENWLSKNVNIPFKGFEMKDPIEATRKQLRNLREGLKDQMPAKQLAHFIESSVPEE